MTKLFYFIAFLIVFPSLAFAETSPIGYWQSYDLHKQARNLIKISLQDGKLVGTITKVAPEGNQAVCSACSGKWQNKPLLHLPIIWGLKKAGNTWVDGQVLNIDNGKIYRCNLAVSDDNKFLYFTAYVAIPLFGAKLKWERVE